MTGVGVGVDYRRQTTLALQCPDNIRMVMFVEDKKLKMINEDCMV